MKIYLGYLIIGLALLLGVQPIRAADTLSVRYFDQKQLEELQQDRAYYYDRPPPNPSLWEKIMTWLDNWLNRNLGRDNVNTLNDIWRKYLRYILVLFIVGIALQRVLKTQILGVFFKTPPKVVHKVDNASIENIAQINFEQLIQQALAQKDYRLAVRWYYLQMLQELSRRNYIDWQPNKTNEDYQSELQKSPYYQDFQQLRWLFDHVWYGEFPINTERFNEVEQQFRQLNKQLRNA